MKKITPKEIANEEEYKIEDFRATTRLLFENEKLQQRIDKAIEYLNIILKSTPSCGRKKAGLILINYKRFLEILGGINE